MQTGFESTPEFPVVSSLGASADRRLLWALAGSAIAHLILLWPSSLPVVRPMLGTRLEATLERTPVQHQVVPEHDTPLGNSAGEHIDQPVRPTLDERLKSRSRSTTAAIPDGRRDNAVPQHAQEHASSSAEAVRRPAGARDLEPAAAATADADGLRSFRIALALNARRFRSQLTVESGSVGTTQIRVSIGENGLTRDVAITHSSGDNALDREAQTLLTQAARATMLPETLRGVDFSVDLSVVFDAH